MSKTNKKVKTLAQLKEDRDKAGQDLQRFQQNLIMVQGIITYLNNEIAKMEQGGGKCQA